MSVVETKQMFPCPVCTRAREVRITKKDKPYFICDPCGIQVFVRGPAGIAEFERLLVRAKNQGTLDRLKEIERRYRSTCSDCGSQFWAGPRLIKTSTFDGSLKGFRCPGKDCDAIVPWEQAQ